MSNRFGNRQLFSTDRNSLQLLDLLDFVAGGSSTEALEPRGSPALRQLPLLRVDFVVFRTVIPAKNNLIFAVVLVEQRLLVVHRSRSNLHLERMLFGVLLDLLEMLVVAVLRQPGDNVAVRPVDLQRVRVLIVDVVLDGRLI